MSAAQILHGLAAKVAMAAAGIKVFGGWPGYSPEMNPPENVWAWVELERRRQETEDDPFGLWVGKALEACKVYPSSLLLIPSMASRMRDVHDNDGAMTKY